ncbi:MAG TPA: Holliday junction branch migration protein RuvA [Bacillota bacterium]|nr:Holliday junction branch migration protein RuvA [Bacillota bacterium]
MIAFIRGTLVDITETHVFVDVQGVGYQIECANPYVFQQEMNKEVFIYTYHHVREDSQTLYGFKTEDEKQLFEKLISVSGIGPKSGLNIQGTVQVNDFISAVEREDEKYLMQFPGIGKKTSRQIILDLKGKLTDLATTIEIDGASETEVEKIKELEEAKAALKALGYVDREIQAIVPQLRKSKEANTDDLVRKALSLLMKN